MVKLLYRPGDRTVLAALDDADADAVSEVYRALGTEIVVVSSWAPATLWKRLDLPVAWSTLTLLRALIKTTRWEGADAKKINRASLPPRTDLSASVSAFMDERYKPSREEGGVGLGVLHEIYVAYNGTCLGKVVPDDIARDLENFESALKEAGYEIVENEYLKCVCCEAISVYPTKLDDLRDIESKVQSLLQTLDADEKTLNADALHERFESFYGIDVDDQTFLMALAAARRRFASELNFSKIEGSALSGKIKASESSKKKNKLHHSFSIKDDLYDSIGTIFQRPQSGERFFAVLFRNSCEEIRVIVLRERAASLLLQGLELPEKVEILEAHVLPGGDLSEKLVKEIVQSAFYQTKEQKKARAALVGARAAIEHLRREGDRIELNSSVVNGVCDFLKDGYDVVPGHASDMTLCELYATYYSSISHQISHQIIIYTTHETFLRALAYLGVRADSAGKIRDLKVKENSLRMERNAYGLDGFFPPL